jgi:Fur family ferric uptake transcriptional regulator
MSHQNWDYPTLLHDRGFRVTPQRQLILDAICDGAGHTTPEEIYARVHARTSHLNRATVYRNLDFLCELRLVVAMQTGGQWYYEIASETPHHHLVCHNCNRVEELDHTALKNCFDKIERAFNFTVDMDHVALFGLCAKCRASAQRSSHRKSKTRAETLKHLPLDRD